MKIKCDRKLPCSHCLKAKLKCEYLHRRKQDEEGRLSLAKNAENASDKTELPISVLPAHFIDKRVSVLEEKFETLASRLKGDCIPKRKSGDKLAFLDWKLPYLKCYMLAAKPSRTIFMGPLSRYSLLSRPMFKYMMISMKDLLDMERREYKKNHKVSIHLHLLPDGTQEDALVADIQRLICVNYYAFQERLIFFQNHLNNLLYSEFIPMDMVHSLFMTRFHDPDNDGKAQFLQPRKPYLYVDVAVVVSIVYLVVVFTRYNSFNESFRCKPVFKEGELSTLAFRCLNISDFRRKKTQLALISLLVLRSALFVHDNFEGASEDINSYPVYQLSLDMCYQMGLHLDPKIIGVYMFKEKLEMKRRTLKIEKVFPLWNYMLEEDAIYSSVIGCPLLINSKFCSGFRKNSNFFFDNKREHEVNLLRKIDETINSLQLISLNNLLELVNEVLLFCYDLPSSMFEVANSSFSDLDQLACLCRIKLTFMQILQCLSKSVIMGISNSYEKNHNAINNPKTMEILTNISHEMYRICLLAAVSTMLQIEQICNGESVFGKEPDGIYIVYFRDIFTRSMTQSSVIWYSYVLAKVSGSSEIITEHKDDPFYLDSKENGSEKTVDFTLENAENALFHKFKGINGEQLQCFYEQSISIPEMIIFLSKFYSAACKHHSIKNSMDSFLTLKSVINLVCTLEIIQEYKEKVETKEMKFSDIMTMAKERIENSFTLGRLEDNVASNRNDDVQMEKIFDSLFVNKDWDIPSEFEVQDNSILEQHVAIDGGAFVQEHDYEFNDRQCYLNDFSHESN